MILQLDKILGLCLNIIIYHTLLYQINIVDRSRLEAISKRHAKTLTKFYSRQDKAENLEPKQIPKNYVHNFSRFMASNDELVVLWFGLYHQIPISKKKK